MLSISTLALLTRNCSLRIEDSAFWCHGVRFEIRRYSGLQIEHAVHFLTWNCLTRSIGSVSTKKKAKSSCCVALGARQENSG